MTYAANVHVAVYQVLDHLISSSVAPPGAKAEIHSIIDVLRSASAPHEMIGMAEDISLRMHRLEAALNQGDEASARGARRDLQDIAAAWLNFRVMN